MAWRCHDCFANPVFCTHCLQERHQMQPFHRVSRWNGKCFTPSSLANAGLTLNLGHGGGLCPVYHRLLPLASERGAKTTAHDSLSKNSGNQNFPSADMQLLCPPDDASSAADDCTPGRRTSILPDDQRSSNIGIPSDIEGTAPPPEKHTIPPITVQRFWEVAGSIPYEATTPVNLCMQDLIQRSQDVTPIGLDDDPFFANESDDEESWKNVRAGGLPLRIKHDNRKYDKWHCPVVTVVDTTGIHEMRVRFCRCQSLKVHPLQTQFMNSGMYTSSNKRTRTVFTFRVLHHFDITNLEGKVTAWQYYRTLQRLTSNVFTDTVADRYRELMRALRQWRDLSNRRRAGEPLDPGIVLKPGDLALFCPACPQPGINLPDDWEKDTNQLAPSLRVRYPTHL